VPRQINEAGLKLIKDFEGVSLVVYKDIAGHLTVGYGHMDDSMDPAGTITQAQADQYLIEDLASHEDDVSALVKVDVTDNQFAALVSFCYNLGASALKRSTLLKCVNSYNFEDAAKAFAPWDMSGGRTVEGLTRRRAAEAALFSLS
jgi:lysozyme